MLKNKLRALLIEDDLGDADLLREMLADEKNPSFEIVHAARLKEGLELLGTKRFDIILTDLGLPDSNRAETFILEHSKAPHLPIVILSGSIQDDTSAREAVRAGAQDYLVKGKVDGKMLSRAIQYAIERKRLLQLRDDFVNLTSHELRTPLTVIRDGVAQILEGLHGGTTPEQNRILSMALFNVDRLNRMINDLLDISKIEDGKVTLQIHKLDLAGLIRQVVDLLQIRAKEKGLQIKVNVPAEGLPINADADKMTQVITNLVGNSIKFTQKGCIEISALDKGEMLELVVQDTGRGITGADLSKIAEKFQQ